MNKIKLFRAQFEQFVNSMPADAKVDNTFGWDNCAVGEFANSISVPVELVANTLWYEYGAKTTTGLLTSSYSNMFDIPTKSYETLMDKLNFSDFTTYGGIQKAIKEEPNDE